LKDFGLLDSALARPRASAFGEDAYQTLVEKVAALMHSLINNHSLVDGNKRAGLLIGSTFLGLNGFKFAHSNDEMVEIILEVADTGMNAGELSKRLKISLA
jgi:death-on-curing protein